MTNQRMIKVKVCGMKDVTNIHGVDALAPDYLGFIEFDKSPRFINDLIIPESISKTANKVGVFVNASLDSILARSSFYDFIQLHGEEPPLLLEQLKDKGVKIIKVFSVDETFDFVKTKSYVPLADFFLFDTKGKLYGGNAKIFDWNLLKHYDQEVPFFLSGGLSPDNLPDIGQLEHMNLHGVDLNSGVEISPGIKDIQKVAKAIEQINKFNKQTTN